MPYKTIQKSWLHFILIPLMIILILFTRHFSTFWLAVVGGITVGLFLVHSLIIEVNPTLLRIKFGPGLLQKKIKISDIEYCETVENTAWYSFGLIRFGPDFTLYNVSGRSAVELTLTGKQRKVRVGTDKPELVCQAINKAKTNEKS